ncbi:MAG: hypothetical protein FWF40_02475, partial [Methanomassiliicoccaceae archaeon]|nr:hypothetical protein [Methanomassiliicoccaceae archaeon]
MRHKAVLMSAIAVAVLIAASLTALLPAWEGENEERALGSSECPVLVNNITNLPNAATVGEPLALSGTVSPSNASYTDIIWSLVSAGTTGASVTGNTFSATATGTATVTATIEQQFTDIKMVAAGYYHTVAIRDDGTLWAWGLNDKGQLGIGVSGASRITPVQVGTDNDWSQVAVGYIHTVAIKEDGTLWAWGLNDKGQLGDGTNTNRDTPVQEATGSTDWEYASAGGDHTVAIKDDGTLWAWGLNDFGQLGNGVSGAGT